MASSSSAFSSMTMTFVAWFCGGCCCGCRGCGCGNEMGRGWTGSIAKNGGGQHALVIDQFQLSPLRCDTIL
eukprot:scaffold289947_cov51-Attheya_sp.AAC.4